MNRKQEDFCRWYVRTKFHKSKAAIKAGYSPRSAHSIACKLLKIDEIQEKIKEILQKKDKKLDFWREKVLDELAGLAFSDITNYLTVKDGEVKIKNIGEATPATGAIASISQKQSKHSTSIKFKFWDKVRSLEAMAKLLGLDLQDEVGKQDAFDRLVDVLENRYKNSGDKDGNG